MAEDTSAILRGLPGGDHASGASHGGLGQGAERLRVDPCRSGDEGQRVVPRQGG